MLKFPRVKDSNLEILRETDKKEEKKKKIPKGIKIPSVSRERERDTRRIISKMERKGVTRVTRGLRGVVIPSSEGVKAERWKRRYEGTRYRRVSI